MRKLTAGIPLSSECDILGVNYTDFPCHTTTMASSAPAPPASGAFAVMASRTADLDETWTFLNAGVDHIMNNIEEGLSFAGYTNLYTTVYNYCTSTKMHGRLDGNRCMSHIFDSKTKTESQPFSGRQSRGL